MAASGTAGRYPTCQGWREEDAAAVRGARVQHSEGMVAVVEAVQRLRESCLQSSAFAEKTQVEVELGPLRRHI